MNAAIRRPARGWRSVVAALAALAVLTGCQGAYDLPLPGGAATGGDAYRVTIEFADVLDLVPRSSVKVNDVTVGAVEDITLDGWSARVVVRLAGDVELPDNAVATLRQTSLLGEKFVSLSPPPVGEPVGRLTDGDLIPLERSERNAEVEEVLGALSLLLNGGGVAQLQIINRELSDALEGRESDVRGVIEQLDVFVSGLEQQKSEIVRAIEAIDRLAATLARQKEDLAVALDQIPGGLQVLADQREQLTGMLTALSDLGVTATRVINASQQDTVANLRALDPVLSQLAASGDALTDALELFLTYPFADSAVEGIKGDYTNLQITVDANFEALCLQIDLPSCTPDDGPIVEDPTIPTPADVCEEVGGVLGGDGVCTLTEQACEQLGGIFGNGRCELLKEVCDKFGVPVLGECTTPPSTGGGEAPGTPTLPTDPDLLDSLTGGLLGAGSTQRRTTTSSDRGLSLLLLGGLLA